MTNVKRLAACLALLAPLAFAQNAAGAALEFCTQTVDDAGNKVFLDSEGTVIEGPCKTAYVENLAAIVVQGVKIKQKSSHKKGCADTTKRYKANLAIQSRFTVALDPACNYVANFQTSDGCTGDKQAQLTHEELNRKGGGFGLTGACGTLKATAK